MRIAWAVLVVMLPGCLFEPGLGTSPTDCPVSTPLDDGFHILFEDPSPFVGYCVEIARSDDSIDHPFAARKVPASGHVYLPVERAGEYYMQVRVEHADDKYCAEAFGEFKRHPGSGIVEVAGHRATMCA